MKKAIFLACALVVVFCSFCFADQVTMTTDYPAPFGMYQEMRVMGKLGVGTADPQANFEVVGSISIAGGSGDVNGSGGTNATDAVQIKQYVEDTRVFTKAQLAEADVDGDGIVSMEDARIVELIVVGTPKERAKKYVHRTAHKDIDAAGGKLFIVNGKLGVGTTDPQANLDVDGSVIFTGGSGDVNASGGINATDALLVALYINGTQVFTRKQMADADVDADGLITSEDASIIKWMTVGYTREQAKRMIHDIARQHMSGNGASPDKYFLVDGKVGFGLEPGAQASDYPLQVGIPTGTVPASANGIAVAIKNDLWVDGNIYANDVGGWTRDNTNGLLHPTTLTDKVGVGTSDPRALLDVNPALFGARDEQRTTNVLSVGRTGTLSSGATAKIYGTMLVSDAASFGGKVSAYKNIQIIPNGGNVCDNTHIGEMTLYASPEGSTMGLWICSPCKTTEPNKSCPDVTSPDWVSVKTWLTGLGGPVPPVGGESGEPEIFLD